MKKILLGTSALIGAATFFAGAALADDPKVTIGGFSTFEAGFIKSDDAGDQQKTAFRNENEIHFNVAGKTDGGLGYGAELDLNADINGAGAASAASQGDTRSGLNARRTYGYLQGDQWGHLEYGSNDGVARTLKVDASNVARATGGIDGDWTYFADTNNTYNNLPTNTANAVTNAANAAANASALSGQFAGGRSFITAPRLPLEQGSSSSFYNDSTVNNTKITYYTPRFAGFQLGVSYAPSLNDSGQLDGRDYNTGDVNNIWEGGLNYENQFDAIGVAAALTGELGKVSNITGVNDQNVEAYNAGAKVSYLGFSVAGSYGDWRDSENVDGTTAKYWTGGLAYEINGIGASLTYLGSKTDVTGQSNKFDDFSLGVDYKLAPGLTPFVEWTYYDLNATGGAANTGQAENKGNVILVGSQLSF